MPEIPPSKDEDELKNRAKQHTSSGHPSSSRSKDTHNQKSSTSNKRPTLSSSSTNKPRDVKTKVMSAVDNIPVKPKPAPSSSSSKLRDSSKKMTKLAKPPVKPSSSTISKTQQKPTKATPHVDKSATKPSISASSAHKPTKPLPKIDSKSHSERKRVLPPRRPMPMLDQKSKPEPRKDISTSKIDNFFRARQKYIKTLAPKERAEQEKWAQSKIDKQGCCDQGYTWKREGNGYRCDGGAHSITDAMMASGGKGGLINYLGPYYKAEGGKAKEVKVNIVEEGWKRVKPNVVYGGKKPKEKWIPDFFYLAECPGTKKGVALREAWWDCVDRGVILSLFCIPRR